MTSRELLEKVQVLPRSEALQLLKGITLLLYQSSNCSADSPAAEFQQRQVLGEIVNLMTTGSDPWWIYDPSRLEEE